VNSTLEILARGDSEAWSEDVDELQRAEERDRDFLE
jgi:hypothetical protein